MVTKTVDLQAVTTSLEELLALVQADTEILLVKGETPLARLSPVAAIDEETAPPRIPDLHPGAWVSEDFNDPLPDEFWLGEV